MSGRFSNPWPHHEHGLAGVIRWKLGLGPRNDSDSGRSGASNDPVAWIRVAPDGPPENGWRVTWLGHASFLVQGCGRSLLIDPVFSDHCAPLPLPGLRRLVPVPVSLSELPTIDGVLVTHSHYDHLDLATLGSLRQRHPEMKLLIAEGHGSWLRDKGFEGAADLPWYGAIEWFDGLRVTSTPAQHFTARTPFDRNRGHWCGWRLEGGGKSLWHAGDSGYCPAFKEMRQRLGEVDFGMIPIGAYAPRWFMEPMHMTPEEAAEAFIDAGCGQAVGMHWGTYRLTDEPLGEPAVRLADAVRRLGLEGRFVTGLVGQSWELGFP